MRARIRRFFRPIFRRPFPVFLTPTSTSSIAMHDNYLRAKKIKRKNQATATWFPLVRFALQGVDYRGDRKLMQSMCKIVLVSTLIASSRHKIAYILGKYRLSFENTRANAFLGQQYKANRRIRKDHEKKSICDASATSTEQNSSSRTFQSLCPVVYRYERLLPMVQSRICPQSNPSIFPQIK
jgi:hypothetical protein